jgi:hypothetical protein
MVSRRGAPLAWFPISAGAKISMDSGVENMDWIARVLRRLVSFTQAGGEVNLVVNGINVGAQPYWNAEATVLITPGHSGDDAESGYGADGQTRPGLLGRRLGRRQ